MPDHARDAAFASSGWQFLTFRLDDQDYGVEILKVQEIIGVPPITRVPGLPPSVAGVFDLRGTVIPVVDLHARLGRPPRRAGDAPRGADDEPATRCVIVAHVAAPDGATVPVGLLVDGVREVATIRDEDVEDAPAFGAGVRTDFLLGFSRAAGADGHGTVTMLLDLDRALAARALAPPAVAA